jgi:hypothetical protein
MNEKPNALPCRRCGRMVRSEKDGRGGKWRIPPLKLCPNCTEIKTGNYARIKILKAPKVQSFKELRSYLPFYIIDKIENKLIKECKKLDEISYLFHDYKIQRPTSDVFVLDTQSRNFTNYFIDNIVQ